MHGSVRVNRQLVSSYGPEAIDAREKNVPSPLAGEGQGEGERKTRERCEHLNLKLDTAHSMTRFSHPPPCG